MYRISHETLDVMTVLEVESQMDEDSLCETYVVKRNGLTLEITLPWTEPRATISIQQEGESHPLLSLSFWGRGIRRVIDKRGELLEFSDCVMGNVGLRPADFSMSHNTPTCSILLWLKPQIRVQLD